MKVVHICLCGAMTDNFNYQENLLAKYHKKLGYTVTLVASQWIWGNDGKLRCYKETNYINKEGVKIIRIPTMCGNVNNRLKIYPKLYRTVADEKPDILFIHDCQFLDICQLARYAKKHKEVHIFVDNHVDFSNGAHGWLSKNILHKILWRYCISRIEPYVIKFYGVLPARVDFMKELYKIPERKCELLVMGGDDDLINKNRMEKARSLIRKKYDIIDDDFLVVTGGKINQYRPETLNLMKAVANMKSKYVKLLVFGNVSEKLKNEFEYWASFENIIYVGWLESEDTYKYLAAADLVVFPGLHSVMWEQAVAIGIPGIFRKIPGFEHVDLNGNCYLIEDITEEGLRKNICEIVENKEKYKLMKQITVDRGMEYFSYYKIAQRSIQQ